jgi:hypothetical protein
VLNAVFTSFEELNFGEKDKFNIKMNFKAVACENVDWT